MSFRASSEPLLAPARSPWVSCAAWQIAGVEGEVILPTSDGFETARLIRNAHYDAHPAVIVRPSGAADVARAVTFAADSGLPIAVRSGGHSLAGYSTVDGGSSWT